MSNKKLPKVNMHGLILLREEGQGLLYMDIELQQHKLHMQALQCLILWSNVVLTEPLAIFFLKTKAEKLNKGKHRENQYSLSQDTKGFYHSNLTTKGILSTTSNTWFKMSACFFIHPCWVVVIGLNS